MRNRILIGVSLAVIIMLAVPLGLMAASIIRGESPRQMAEKDQMDDVEPGNQEDDKQTDVLKPVVQPDPGPMPPPPVMAVAEPEAEQDEDAPAEAEAAPTPVSPKKQTPKKTTPKTTKKSSGTTLPKAVLGPGEAPCMVDGLDGYAYDYS